MLLLYLVCIKYSLHKVTLSQLPNDKFDNIFGTKCAYVWFTLSFLYLVTLMSKFDQLVL